jgi:hypothetical protein
MEPSRQEFGIKGNVERPILRVDLAIWQQSHVLLIQSNTKRRIELIYFFFFFLKNRKSGNSSNLQRVCMNPNKNGYQRDAGYI